MSMLLISKTPYSLLIRVINMSRWWVTRTLKQFSQLLKPKYLYQMKLKKIKRKVKKMCKKTLTVMKILLESLNTRYGRTYAASLQNSKMLSTNYSIIKCWKSTSSTYLTLAQSAMKWFKFRSRILRNQSSPN